MEQKILAEILKDTFTVGSLKKRYHVIKIKLQKQIYGASELESGHKATADMDRYKKEEEWFEKFDQSLISNITSDQFSVISKYIDTFIYNLKSLSIYFVFIPSDEQLEEIGSYLRKNLNKPDLVFETKVDPSLIGGCAIVYNGIYKDYSLRAKINGNKDQLMAEFRKYFKQ